MHRDYFSGDMSYHSRPIYTARTTVSTKWQGNVRGMSKSVWENGRVRGRSYGEMFVLRSFNIHAIIVVLRKPQTFAQKVAVIIINASMRKGDK